MLLLHMLLCVHHRRCGHDLLSASRQFDHRTLRQASPVGLSVGGCGGLKGQCPPLIPDPIRSG